MHGLGRILIGGAALALIACTGSVGTDAEDPLSLVVPEMFEPPDEGGWYEDVARSIDPARPWSMSASRLPDGTTCISVATPAGEVGGVCVRLAGVEASHPDPRAPAVIPFFASYSTREIPWRDDPGRLLIVGAASRAVARLVAAPDDPSLRETDLTLLASPLLTDVWFFVEEVSRSDGTLVSYGTNGSILGRVGYPGTPADGPAYRSIPWEIY